MDIFSHGLWALAASKVAERHTGRRLPPWRTLFWGMFPDLFAFGVPFLWLIWAVFTGGMTLDNVRPQNGHFNPSLRQSAVMSLAPQLYNWSHSLFVIVTVFLIVWWWRSGRRGLRRDRFPLVMLGWPLHVLMDVPTHSLEFYPTPLFWPFSDWKFDGIVWGQTWFMLLNYGLLLAAAVTLRLTAKKRAGQGN
jgi:hypothetical protein